jgi:hypothetical protein
MPNILNIQILPNIQSFIQADINIRRNCIYKGNNGMVRYINYNIHGIKIKYYHN